jgi:hypothetical protein
MPFWKARAHTLMVEPKQRLTFEEVEQVREFLHRYKGKIEQQGL